MAGYEADEGQGRDFEEGTGMLEGLGVGTMTAPELAAVTDRGRRLGVGDEVP